MADDATISPRGVPPIRTDWLADVAWRLAALGLDELRTTGVESFETTDVVDGIEWCIRPFVFCMPTEAVVDLDGDLTRPNDPDGADLRIGVGITPVFDDEHGRQLQVRIEIGPRGPVTFDPENWIFTFPLELIQRGERPAVPGLVAGTFSLGAGSSSMSEGSLDDLAAVGGVQLGDLVELAEGRRSWTTVIGLTGEPPRKRRFGFGGAKPAETFATLTLIADGELRITPDAALAGSDFNELQPADSIDVQRDRIVIDAPSSAIPGGRLTITGVGLQARLHRLPG
jgi:hypothetical protein